jgi:hypothetical protein
MGWRTFVIVVARPARLGRDSLPLGNIDPQLSVVDLDALVLAQALFHAFFCGELDVGVAFVLGLGMG